MFGLEQPPLQQQQVDPAEFLKLAIGRYIKKSALQADNQAFIVFDVKHIVGEFYLNADGRKVQVTDEDAATIFSQVTAVLKNKANQSTT